MITIVVILLLLALLFGGLGFAAHVLWVIAVVLFIAFVIAYVVGHGRR